MTDFNITTTRQTAAGSGMAAAPEDVRPVSVSARLGRLQFHRSGKFRVLQLADIQDSPKVNKDTVRLIAAALDAARPDVVIFTGNQIAGYDDVFRDTFRRRRWDDANRTHIGVTTSKVRVAMGEMLRPLIERGIPFAWTYGNHDMQSGLDTSVMEEMVRYFPGCLNPPSPAAAEPFADAADDAADVPFVEQAVPESGLPDQRVISCEPGTFALPVMSADRSRVVLGLVVLDSGDYAREGGYGSPSARALRFLREVPQRIGGARSLVFQHLPLPQYYDVLRTVPSNEENAMQGYRTHDAQYYVLDPDRTLPGGYLGEGVSCPDHDSGEFAILRDTDGYIGVVAGHDHRNGFVGSLNGLMLVATPTCGFSSYGPAAANRAARLFEFDIRHPYSPRTQLLTYGELVGKPSGGKAYTFAVEGQSNAAGGDVNLLKKPGLLAGVAAVLKKL
ncbi:metallophosphoesterase [Bifidobacterium leontopitheci]|nr:metallophosphoesterase [Bifidobacterium leontopitheci]